MPRRRTAPRSNEPFLLAMRLLRDEVPSFDVYPFQLPGIRSLHELPLDARVTFLAHPPRLPGRAAAPPRR